MDIDIPEIVAEVAQAFRRYEQALSTNDLDTIDTLFWDSPLTLRYGPNGTLLSHGAISDFPQEHAHHHVRARPGRGQYRIRPAELGRHGPPKPDLGTHAGRLAHRLRPRLGRASIGLNAWLPRRKRRAPRANFTTMRWLVVMIR
jgi:hypothetical protein